MNIFGVYDIKKRSFYARDSQGQPIRLFKDTAPPPDGLFNNYMTRHTKSTFNPIITSTKSLPKQSLSRNTSPPTVIKTPKATPTRIVVNRSSIKVSPQISRRGDRDCKGYRITGQKIDGGGMKEEKVENVRPKSSNPHRQWGIDRQQKKDRVDTQLLQQTKISQAIPHLSTQPRQLISSNRSRQVDNFKIDWFMSTNQSMGVTISEVVGVGAFCSVHKGWDHTLGKEVALKVFDKRKNLTSADRLSVQAEVDALKAVVNHPNVIQLLRVAQNPSTLCIVTEYWGETTLEKYLKARRLNHQEFKSLAMQLISAVAHIHSVNVFHRDIKAENVMIRKCPENGKLICCLIDFGLAVKCEPEYWHNSRSGTKFCMSREMYFSTPYKGGPHDVWSLGVLLYQMLTGTLPFGGKPI